MDETDEKNRLNINRITSKRRSPSPRPIYISNIPIPDTLSTKDRLKNTDEYLTENFQLDENSGDERRNNINTDSQVQNDYGLSFNRSCRRLSSYIDEDDVLPGTYSAQRKSRQYARKSADSEFGERYRRLSQEMGYKSDILNVSNVGIIPEALLNVTGTSVDGFDNDGKRDFSRNYPVINDEDFGQTNLNIELD